MIQCNKHGEARSDQFDTQCYECLREQSQGGKAVIFQGATFKDGVMFVDGKEIMFIDGKEITFIHRIEFITGMEYRWDEDHWTRVRMRNLKVSDKFIFDDKVNCVWTVTGEPFINVYGDCVEVKAICPYCNSEYVQKPKTVDAEMRNNHESNS